MHVGLDASQRFTLSVDREKGIYAGKILAISEDGATITQQMGKGIVELDHRTENLPEGKAGRPAPGTDRDYLLSVWTGQYSCPRRGRAGKMILPCGISKYNSYS